MTDNLVLNIPHSSDFLPINTWNGDIATEIKNWTDWFTDIMFKPNNNIQSKYTINSVIFPVSRFFCDAERLLNDPMESVGQGIYYTDFNGCHRDRVPRLANIAGYYYFAQQAALQHHINKNTLVIDCHSFPSSHCPDVDICIGFNNDWSKPSDDFIKEVVKYFESYGYKVGVNSPYSNSITPKADFEYKSMMIELNKKIYMDEKNTKLLGSSYKINLMLNYLYENILTKWINC